MKFYDKVLSLCYQNGIAITTLAEKIGYQRSAAMAWKKMKKMPRPETVKKVADYFGVSVTSLMQDDKPQIVIPDGVTEWTADEIMLIEAYRKMTTEQKNILLGFSELLLKQG